MIVEAAPAKVNLYLHVTGRRFNGYHELDSLVVFTDVGDRVTVTGGPEGKGPRLFLTGPFASALAAEDPESNLVIRAVRGLARSLGRDDDVSVTLHKELPVASGIGGGSADAAATLRALALLWNLPDDDSRLYTVGATLGADVPVCIASRPSYFAGIGDILSPAPPLPETYLVLVNPGVAVPTPSVFKVRSGLFSETARLEREPTDARDLARQLALRRNDLSGPAASLAPVILSAMEALAATPECLLSRLSGSGATCFGLFAEREAAAAAAAQIAKAHPSWWVTPTRVLE